MELRGSVLGNAVQRVEDPRFLKGEGRYMDDVRDVDALNVMFVRSTFAHAKIKGIDTSEAEKMPGVAGVFTAQNLELPGFFAAGMLAGMVPNLARAPLATDTARFVGEVVAAVVAETRQQAVDAAEAVVVEYEPLPAVIDLDHAGDANAPVLFPAQGNNVAFAMDTGTDESVLDGADVVVKGRFENQRLAAVPMEVNGAIVLPDSETGGIKMYASTQAPFGNRDAVAGVLGLEPDQVHVITPAVGGGFGAKAGSYVEHAILGKLAMQLGRGVRWIESRSENLVAMTHGRAQIQYIEIGAKRDGTIVGLRAKVLQDVGAYPDFGMFLPTLTKQMACGVYAIPKVEFNFFSYLTNTTPVSAYRGAGRPEAAAMLERAIDMVADELGLDPADVRRKNFIPKDAFPHTTVTGAEYDIGDYALPLEEALKIAEYDKLLAEQEKRRAAGDRKQLGVGIGVYVEITGGVPPFSEYSSVEVHTDGAVTVRTGTSPHGQGHETAWAQIASSVLGIPMDKVTVVHSDTKLVERGLGTMGSRSLQQGGTAVYQASEAVVDKAKKIAAQLLEASEEDIAIEDGKIGVAGTPAKAFTWEEIAQTANDKSKLPEGVEPGLSAVLDFQAPGPTYPFGAHVAVVEVDTETGMVDLVRHIAVDDCGRVLNPLLTGGQVHGGAAQGIAQALFESFEYDSDGNPLTATLVDYAMPAASELPSFENKHTETPTPLNPLGAKGIGESATIGSTPAVQNAVVDALSHLGVRHIDMPLTPERVWRAIQAAQ